MAARLALHRLDVKRTFEAKMRDFVVKHKTDLKFKIYEEATPGRDVTGPRQGRVVSHGKGLVTDSADHLKF